MDLFVSAFVILVAVAFSNILARLIPKVSAAYINIATGIMVGLIPLTNHLVLAFDNEIFMILILAPILYFEGQKMPMVIVRRWIPRIMGVAVFLVIASAFLSAFALHLTFGLALPLALVIMAISTPTDATALESVIEGRMFRKSIAKTLKMESLFNDATGIILLQAGLIWTQTGHLELWQNIGHLLLAALGGIIVGAVLQIGIILFRQVVLRSSANVVSSQILIYIMTPLVIYFVSEKLGVSGIIAVVVAGLLSNSESVRSRFSHPKQIQLSLGIVDLSSTVLNSFVFVILGINFIRIFAYQRSQLAQSLIWLWVGIGGYVALLLCRFIYGKFFVGDHSFRGATLFALGGVHGTVTLAMTFSILGVTGVSQNRFNFVILVETVLIILSMLVPTIVFKLWLPVDLDAKNRIQEIDRLRKEMVAVGRKHVDTLELSPVVHEIVYYDLQDQIQCNSMGTFLRQWQATASKTEVLTGLQSLEQRRALMQAFNEERAYLYDLAKRHVVNSEYIYTLYEEVLLAESLILNVDH